MIPFPNKKYQIIYADPPYRFSQGIHCRKDFVNNHNVKEELHIHYKTMSDNEIINMPLKEISGKQCVLFLWTTDAHLEVAIKAINNWGFKYKTVAFVWSKKRNGNQALIIGKWNIKSCEICLLATKGTAHKLVKNFKVRQLVEAERGKHSQKPREVRNRINEMFGDLPRIELFARPPKDLLFEDESYKGWDVWGNEC